MDKKMIKETCQRDDFELFITDAAEYSQILEEFTKERKWYTSDEDYAANNPKEPVPRAQSLNFFPLHNEPLMAPALLAEKFERTETLPTGKVKKTIYTVAKDVNAEVLMDSMSEDVKNTTKHQDGFHGTSLMCAIEGGEIYPVGWSAVPALQSALGLRSNGQINLQSYNPEDLAAVYNMLATAALGKGFTACTAFGKWRAFNGPRYAVTDDKFIWDACFDMLKKYPKAKFAQGYISHGLTRWVIDLAEYQQDLFGQYAAVLGQKFTPILIVETSNTRDSAVNLVPGLKIAKSFVPLAQNITKRHTAAGNYEERIGAMQVIVKQAFAEVMPLFEDAAKEAVKLQSIDIKYGRVTLERAAYALGYPQKETFAQAEIFTDIYGIDVNGILSYPDITAYDLWLALSDIVSEAEYSGKHDQMTILGMYDGLGRAIKMDWPSLDDGRSAPWVKAPKKP